MNISLLGRVFLAVAMFALVVSAADVTGKWTSTITMPNGQTRESAMNLKADGEKLTGTIAGRGGDTEIQDGKVNGDQISFVVVRNFQGNEMKMKYNGKVAGDEIKFNVEMGDRSFEMTAKRAK